MTDTSETDQERYARFDQIRKLLFPELFGDPREQLTGPQSDYERIQASRLVGDIMAGQVTPGLIEHLQKEAAGLRSELEQLTRSRNELSTSFEEQRRELADLRRGRERRDGVDPFVLELDSYRTAMADLYRHVLGLPEDVPVLRTNEAARQSTAIRARFDELSEKITALHEILPPENRSGFGPVEVLQDAFDELEARRRQIAELWRTARAQRDDDSVDPIDLLGAVSPEAAKLLRAALRFKG